MILLLLSCLFSNAPLYAGDFTEAEHVRISQDLEQLASRQLWTGVEKRFQELLALEATAGMEIMTFEDLVYGAYAARAMGRIQDARDRLNRAARLDGPLDRMKEIADWLDSIRANFGQARLVAHQTRNVELIADTMPLDPDQRLAVEAAMEEVKKNAAFSGLLPRGGYSFAGYAFKVEPGISVTIETSPRLKKTTGELIQVTTEPMVDPSGQ
jgi:hypothetical protein